MLQPPLETALLPSVRAYYTTDKKLRSVPFQVSQPAIYINPDLAKAAGIDISGKTTTMDDIVSWAKAIKEKTGKFGLVFHITPWWMEELTASAGLEYCSPDNGLGAQPAKSMNMTDPAQIKQWTALQELYKDGVAMNVGGDGAQSSKAFSEGQVGILFASSASLGSVQVGATGFTPVLKPFIQDSADGGAVLGGNSVWVIGKDVKDAKVQAAWKFAAYLADPAVQAEVFKTTGYLPNSKAAIEASKDGATDPQKVLLDQLANTGDNHAISGCHTGALQQVRSDLKKGLEAILISNADVEKTLKGVQDRSVDTIASYLKRAGN